MCAVSGKAVRKGRRLSDKALKNTVFLLFY